jgi:hypothetical protein
LHSTVMLRDAVEVAVVDAEADALAVAEDDRDVVSVADLHDTAVQVKRS